MALGPLSGRNGRSGSFILYTLSKGGNSLPLLAVYPPRYLYGMIT